MNINRTIILFIVLLQAGTLVAAEKVTVKWTDFSQHELSFDVPYYVVSVGKKTDKKKAAC